jgi:hypothetical protein
MMRCRRKKKRHCIGWRCGVHDIRHWYRPIRQAVSLSISPARRICSKARARFCRICARGSRPPKSRPALPSRTRRAAPGDRAFFKEEIVAPGRASDVLGGLPVEALRLDVKIVDSLRDVGIERITQLATKLRGSLQTRFGSEVLLRMDQALGAAAEVLVSIVPPEVPRATLRFADPLADPDNLQRVHGVLDRGRYRTANGRQRMSPRPARMSMSASLWTGCASSLARSAFFVSCRLKAIFRNAPANACRQ